MFRNFVQIHRFSIAGGNLPEQLIFLFQIASRSGNSLTNTSPWCAKIPWERPRLRLSRILTNPPKN